MSNIKISQLPAATTPDGTELVPIVQASTTKKVTLDVAVYDRFSADAGSDLVGFLQAGTNAVPRTVQSKLRETVSVNDFGASPSLADNLAALQAAANYACSLGNAELVIPAGIYEFSASRYISTSNQDGIIIDVPDGGVLVIRGAGAGATILRRKASATFNNFASMFIIKNNTNATVLFQDLEIDGNAENITPSVPGDFTYQQTAMVRIQTGTGQMRMLGADNVSMSNPTADGFYFSAQIAACSFSNIYQINRNRTRSDIEFTFVPNRVLISNCNLKDLQAEPAPVTCEAFVVENVVTDHLDIIGNNINTDTFNLFMTNVKATEADGRDTLIRRIKNGHFTNCEFVNIKRLQDVNGMFTNCRLIQRVVTGAVQGVQLDYLTNYPTVLRFDSCHFEAESAGTGAMIQAFTVIANTRTYIPELHIKNCTSDKNAAFFLDANRIGIAYVENSQVKGMTAAFNTSNTAGNVCKLYLKNNTYDAPNVIQMAGTADSVVLVDDVIDGDAISPCTRANSSGSTITFQSKRKILVTASPESSINGLTGDVASLKATGTAGWREWTFTGSSGLNTGWRLSRQRFVRDTTANRPALGAADVGYQYFDTTLDADGKPIWWTGTAWVDATGATV